MFVRGFGEVWEGFQPYRGGIHMRTLTYGPLSKFIKGGISQGLSIKQGFVEFYTQRLIEGNIYRLKLSRLRFGNDAATLKTYI